MMLAVEKLAVSNWSGVLLGIMCLLGIVGSMVWVAWSERRATRRTEDVERWLSGVDDGPSEEA